jgi:hypothetical protein
MYAWDDAQSDFDPRVFQAFVWGDAREASKVVLGTRIDMQNVKERSWLLVSYRAVSWYFLASYAFKR